jgi:glyoxylase-like metal-dependent hydrolase (beta-lactamase superfamily II)
MQGSTVVINPPDGDMTAYLNSLRALLELDLEWLAPGHGFLIARPHDAVRSVIAHRGRRRERVLTALREAGAVDSSVGVDLADLLPRAYDDVKPALFAMATRSLLAHLIELRGEGLAESVGERWHSAR